MPYMEYSEVSDVSALGFHYLHVVHMDADTVSSLQGATSTHLHPFPVLSSPVFVAKVRAREEHIRESWVRAMEVQIVRDELTKCQRAESVNHYENCKSLADKYIALLRENRVGQIFSTNKEMRPI